LPCTENGSCPPGQLCFEGICTLPLEGEEPDADTLDASPGAPDANAEPRPVMCTPVATDDETCDGVDDDCDARFDENAGANQAYYRDADGDGFGVTPAVNACAQPVGHVNTAGDCWDSTTDPAASKLAHPAQSEVFSVPMGGAYALPFDWNCDGQVYFEFQECVPTCGDQRCGSVEQAGWRTTFPDCGMSAEYCTLWDPWEGYCAASEQRAQRCN
jgi:hypothetical protein